MLRFCYSLHACRKYIMLNLCWPSIPPPPPGSATWSFPNPFRTYSRYCDENKMQDKPGKIREIPTGRNVCMRTQTGLHKAPPWYFRSVHAKTSQCAQGERGSLEGRSHIPQPSCVCVCWRVVPLVVSDPRLCTVRGTLSVISIYLLINLFIDLLLLLLFSYQFVLHQVFIFCFNGDTKQSYALTVT